MNMILLVAVLAIFFVLLLTTEDKDRGCTDDCKNCPFPMCCGKVEDKTDGRSYDTSVKIMENCDGGMS